MGAFVLRRVEGKIVHFQTLSFWDSIESIKKFVGEDYEKARYYDEYAKFPLEFEPTVTHYKIFGAEHLKDLKLS